jgi:hypothetical protein
MVFSYECSNQPMLWVDGCKVTKKNMKGVVLFVSDSLEKVSTPPIFGTFPPFAAAVLLLRYFIFSM